jgi:Excalibur calcium-binding domain
VIVTAAPEPTVTLTASPQTIEAGQSATLQWTSTDATTISIDQGIGIVISNGSLAVTPTTTTTYTISATGPGGTASQSVTVVVSAVPAPTVTLTASPQTIQAGQLTTLQWTSTNAMTVSIDNGIGSVALTGSTMRSPAQTTTYTITAQGPGGTRSTSVTVVVTQSNFGPCGSKTTCGQMTSCAEALYYLNTCKVTRLDGDKDGVPCESICPGG